MKEDSFIGEHTEPMSNYDLLTVVMIYTADDFMDLQNDIIKMLSVLLSRNLAAKERMSILEDSFDIAMTEKVNQEVDKMCNLSQGVRAESYWYRKGRSYGHSKGRSHGRIERAQKNYT